MASNYFSGMSRGWVGGLVGRIKWTYNQLSPQLCWLVLGAELGKNES